MQHNKSYHNLLYVKAFATGRRGTDTLKKQHQLVPPQTVEAGLFQPTEHLAADAPNLHPLVVYYIAATLPVKQFHLRAAAVEEHIDRAVRRLMPGRTGYAA